MNGAMDTSGCCGRYRARLILRPGVDGLLTLEVFAATPEAAQRLLHDKTTELFGDRIDWAKVRGAPK